MADDVIVAGFQRLAGYQNRDGGWGYAPGRESSVEPTAAACLAHLVQGAPAPHRALRWLEQAQMTDGSWAVSPSARDSSWVTAWAVWALARAGWRGERLEQGITWLACVPVLTFDDETTAAAVRRLLEVDPAATGWPWQPGEASWVTPTAMSAIALCACGLRALPRLAEARRYLADRACAIGGWNFGNPVMLGQAIPPQATDSGAALLALRHLDTPSSDKDVTGALAWLARLSSTDGSPLDRAWACIGLGVWGRPDRVLGPIREDIRAASDESSLAALSLAMGLMALAPADRLVTVPA
jgi:hypothetical protein